MSKFVRVKIELRELPLVRRALDDLAIPYHENTRYEHRWSGRSEAVPLLIAHSSVSFGLRPAEDGGIEVLGDDLQMRSIERLLDKVRQRYAYHKVLAETAQAGFQLVEEAVGGDGAIRLVVRRWS